MGGVIKITRHLAVNRFGRCFTAKGQCRFNILLSARYPQLNH